MGEGGGSHAGEIMRGKLGRPRAALARPQPAARWGVGRFTCGFRPQVISPVAGAHTLHAGRDRPMTRAMG